MPLAVLGRTRRYPLSRVARRQGAFYEVSHGAHPCPTSSVSTPSDAGSPPGRPGALVSSAPGSATRQRLLRRGLQLEYVTLGWNVVAVVIPAISAIAASSVALASYVGIAWTALTFIAMLALADGKTRTGQQLDNPVLRSEGRVTVVDAYLAGAVLVGLVLDAVLGWWWADPVAGYVIVIYGLKEGRAAWREALAQ